MDEPSVTALSLDRRYSTRLSVLLAHAADGSQWLYMQFTGSTFMVELGDDGHWRLRVVPIGRAALIYDGLEQHDVPWPVGFGPERWG